MSLSPLAPLPISTMSNAGGEIGFVNRLQYAIAPRIAYPEIHAQEDPCPLICVRKQVPSDHEAP